MKHTLYGIGKKLLLVIALMLIFINSIQAQKDKPKEYYTFWQEADRYILEQIVENFSDEIGENLTDEIEGLINKLKEDNHYFGYSIDAKSKFIYTDDRDYIDSITPLIRNKYNDLADLINDLSPKEKNTHRKKVNINNYEETLNEFRKEVNTKIDKFKNKEKGEEATVDTKDLSNLRNKISILEAKLDRLQKEIDGLDSKSTNSGGNNSSPSTYKPTIYFFAGFLLLGLLAVFFLFYILRKNLNNKIAELNAELIAFRSSISRQFEQKDTEWRKRNTEFQNAVSNKINDTQRDLDDLYRRVQQYESNQGSKPAFNQSYADSVQSKPAPPPPPPPKRTITYYLPGPDPSGYFWNDKKSSTPDGSSIYQLVVEEDNQSVGELSFYKGNEKSIKMALSNPSLYIKPVCQSIDNIYSGSTIEMKSPGRLQLSGDKWMIANGEKMKISIR